MKVIFKIYWDNEKPIEKLDDNDRFIKWGDEIINGADHFGHVNSGHFSAAEVKIDGYLSSETKKIADILRKEAQEKGKDIDSEFARYVAGFRNHVLQHGYMKEPTPEENYWKVTKKGKLSQELGGHYKYKEHRKREIEILKNQNFINKILGLTAVAAIICPFIIAIFFNKQPIVNVPLQPNPRVEFHIDSVLLRSAVEDILKSKESMKKKEEERKDTPPTKKSQ
jgi:hypothetical protein